MTVVQEWVAVRFAGTGLKVMAVEPFETVATRLQLGSRDLANISGEKPPAQIGQGQPSAAPPADPLPATQGQRDVSKEDTWLLKTL